jgi:hypothetical protein
MTTPPPHPPPSGGVFFINAKKNLSLSKNGRNFVPQVESPPHEKTKNALIFIGGQKA